MYRAALIPVLVVITVNAVLYSIFFVQFIMTKKEVALFVSITSLLWIIIALLAGVILKVFDKRDI